MTSGLPRAFSQRGKTQTEIERENFERSQTMSIQKAVNSIECPVKEKHVRTAIIGTFQENGGTMFWTVAEKLPLQSNPIVCWKFCYTLHKVLRDGHPSVIPEFQKYTTKLDELGKLWGHLKDTYGKLIKLYIRLLNQKLSFHKKYDRVPGSLKLDDDEFIGIIGHDVDAQFEVSVDMMDYLDDILHLQGAVYGSMDMSRSNSMTTSGQCRLAPLVQCILESSLLYDYIVKLLFKLHSNLPAETLIGHRTRFSQQFTSLSSFFYSSKNLQYYKNLIHVPSLPEQAPNFLIASELSHHARPVAVVQEVVEEPIIDIKPELPPAVPDRFDSMTGFVDEDKRDKRLHDMKQEIDALKRRLRQKESDSHFELNQCAEEHRRLTKEMDMMRSLFEQTSEERNELSTRNKNLLVQLESSEALSQKQMQAGEDKFKKLREIYNKLREDHVTLLRSNADAQRLIKRLQQDLQVKDERINELVGQLELSQNEKIVLQESNRESGNDEELIEAKTSALQLQRENSELVEKLRTANELKLAAEQSCTSNEDTIKELTMTKVNFEANVRELEEKLSDAQMSLAASNESVVVFKNQLEELGQREQFAKTSVASTEEKFVKLQSEMEEVHTQMKRREEESSSHLKRKEEEHVESCLRHCVDVMTNEIERFESPNAYSVRCSAEFLTDCLRASISCSSDLTSRLRDGNWLCLVHDLVDKVGESVLFTKATAVSAAGEHGSALSELSLSCAKNMLVVLEHLIEKQSEASFDVSVTTALDDNLNEILRIADKLKMKTSDVKAEDFGEMIEEEMMSTTSAIEEAASHFEKLLAQSREKDSGVKLEVNEKIIDSCTQLMQNIRVLIEKSRTLQREIVATGRGSSTVDDFYKRHSRWTEGLLSAAKSVAFGASALLQSADSVVRAEGKFEELIVCSQEIAACTTQLMVASQVKANPDSKALQDLKKASGLVTKATGNVVAQAKSCAESQDDQVLQDLSQISLTQSKRLEMNSQVKVLELEAELNKERVRLAALRKKHYQLAGEGEGWDQEDINNADAKLNS